MGMPILPVRDVFQTLVAMQPTGVIRDGLKPIGQALGELGQVLELDSRADPMYPLRLQMVIGPRFDYEPVLQGYLPSEVFPRVYAEVTPAVDQPSRVARVVFNGVERIDVDSTYGEPDVWVNSVSLDVAVNRQGGISSFHIDDDVAYTVFDDLVRDANGQAGDGRICYFRGLYQAIADKFPSHYREEFMQKVPYMRSARSARSSFI